MEIVLSRISIVFILLLFPVRFRCFPIHLPIGQSIGGNRKKQFLDKFKICGNFDENQKQFHSANFQKFYNKMSNTLATDPLKLRLVADIVEQ